MSANDPKQRISMRQDFYLSESTQCPLSGLKRTSQCSASDNSCYRNRKQQFAKGRRRYKWDARPESLGRDIDANHRKIGLEFTAARRTRGSAVDARNDPLQHKNYHRLAHGRCALGTTSGGGACGFV